MKTCLVLLIALFAFPALAATNCDKPIKPSFPDPKTADAAAVQKLETAMQAYAAGTNAYVACLSKDAQQAQAEGKDTILAYNQKFLAVYNKRAAAQ